MIKAHQRGLSTGAGNDWLLSAANACIVGDTDKSKLKTKECRMSQRKRRSYSVSRIRSSFVYAKRLGRPSIHLTFHRCQFRPNSSPPTLAQPDSLETGWQRTGVGILTRLQESWQRGYQSFPDAA